MIGHIQRPTTKPARRRRGHSLIETVISSLLVGAVLVGAMRSFGHVLRGRMSTGDSVRAKQLAFQLMNEILGEDYEDPDLDGGFGAEAGETTGNRSLFDDVDDYHLWSPSQVVARDGSAYSHLANWRREVVVEYVDADNPANTAGADQGLKRITVSVKKNDVVLARQTGLRSDQYAYSAP